MLDGVEEAGLTYLGAGADRPPADGTLVVDIGGGSTELVFGSGLGGRLLRLASGRDRSP